MSQVGEMNEIGNVKCLVALNNNSYEPLFASVYLLHCLRKKRKGPKKCQPKDKG